MSEDVYQEMSKKILVILRPHKINNPKQTFKKFVFGTDITDLAIQIISNIRK